MTGTIVRNVTADIPKLTSRVPLPDQLSLQEGTGENLTHAMSFLPLARSSAMLDYYSAIRPDRLHDGVTEIVAIDFGPLTPPPR
jgi:hypothetical protein